MLFSVRTGPFASIRCFVDDASREKERVGRESRRLLDVWKPCI